MGEDSSGIYIPDLINGEYYVTPDTDIFILSGVPLDNTYEHTIYWKNLDIMRTEQQQYFLSKAKYAIRKNYYQRVDREWMKISINAEMLYDCNYIMFRNTAFNEYKWFYAFILEVEYVNNNTSKIRYEVDVMQTWLPGENRDYQLNPCYVERCHARSDELYENLIPESIVTSNEYLVDDIREFGMNDMSVIVLATEAYAGENSSGNAKFEPVAGSISHGVFGGVAVFRWKLKQSDGKINNAELTRLKKFLAAYINSGKENSIVSMVMFPTVLGPQDQMWSADDEIVITENPFYSVTLNKPIRGDKLGGKESQFVPKNNKLYSYPFNIIKVNNECGTTKVYKWELFDKESIGKFTITGTDIWSPTAIIYPDKYRKISKNMEDSVTFNAFPVCPWSSDAFRAWWAQNAADVSVTALGGFASAVSAVAGGVTGNPMLLATGVGGIISSATKIGTSLYEAEHRPAAEHGSTNTSLILPAIENVKFVLTKESLRPEMLKLYDDYFTRYGYAQKKIMTPPLCNRHNWTYVQTVGFEFTGKINDKDTKKIKSVFDNGITFWADPEEIGNYNIDNYPLEINLID